MKWVLWCKTKKRFFGTLTSPGKPIEFDELWAKGCAEVWSKQGPNEYVAVPFDEQAKRVLGGGA